MATKMKVYEIAKSLNTASKDLIQALNANGFDVKSHNSNIEDDAIAFVLKNFKPKKEEEKKETVKVEKNIKNETQETVKIQEVQEKTVKVSDKKTKENIKKEENSIDKSMEMNKEVNKEVKEDNKKETVEKTVEKTAENSQPHRNGNSVDGNRNNQNRNNNSDRNGTVQNRNNNGGGDRNRNNLNRNNSGDRNTGYQNRNNSNSGDRNTGYQNRNNSNSGDRNTGYQNRNNSNSGDRNTGYQNRNNSNSGDRNTGYQNRNNSNSGDRNTGYQNRNNSNSGDRNTGYQNRNNSNSGDRNTSYQNRNNSNSGDRNTGYQNRNNSNSGDRNTGYQNRNNNGGYQNYNNQSKGNDFNNRQSSGRNTNNNRGGSSYGNKSSFEKSVFETRDTFDRSTMDKTGRSANRNSNGFNNKKKKSNENISTKKDPNRKGAFIMPKPVIVEPEPEDTIKTIVIPEALTIKELAEKMKVQPSAVVKKLFLQGKIVTINQDVTFEEAEEIALEFNCIVELEEQVDVIEELLKEEEEEESVLKKRPPVVCVMGHVDHGKTSLLDAIRKTNVTEREAGGITQHIGAYMVGINGEKITFLDTPGHEAFTSMRMRGAKSTDIAILVVAADDGVMPQTVEAISHAKAAGVEIIVAVNKIDKESANIERVKQELAEYELIAEDWGGSTVFVPVSARTGEGIEQLLEMIILTSEVCELKANPNRNARGIVIEAQLDKGRGPVATILVQKGTLYVGDSIAVGSAYGKIRAMIDDKGRRVKSATPSTPVEILGLNEVPEAGEIFIITDNDKEARNIAETYIKQGREKLLADTKSKLSLDGLFSQIQAGNIKELNLIVKADVQGSVEAVKQSLLKLSNEEVAIRIIHGGVGAINESDVSLASASNAIIIGFNVRPDATAKEIADREKVDLRLYKVIYNAIEDVEAAMKGMLDPVFEEKVIGHAEVRQTFKASGIGTIAGSYVMSGKIVRNSKVRITRAGELIYEGELASLKRFKDDVKEVATGYECGLVFEGYNDVQEEDQVEVYIMVEVPR